MRMSDSLRDFNKKNEMPKHKTDLADEITLALGNNGVYVSVGLANEEMHLNKLDFSEHDKVFEDKIAKLEKQIKSYEAERKELRTRCCMDSAREKFDNHSYGGLVIYTKNFTSECERRLYDENQELKQHIAELESMETEKTDKINLNDRIKVKLTPLGAEIYYHQFDDVDKKIKENGGTGFEPKMPQIDKDGFTEFQLWHFMELYGEHIGMCKKNVIGPLDIIVAE